MPIAIPTSRQALANTYATLGTWIFAATGNPGTTTTVANEVTGGSYARLQTTWTAGAGGIQNGSQVILAIPAGTTVTFGGVASAVSGANQTDNAAITSTAFASAGQLVMTPGYTQT
jgi:hypothetical protein